MTVTGVIWDPVYLEHETDAGHPDHPPPATTALRTIGDVADGRPFHHRGARAGQRRGDPFGA